MALSHRSIGGGGRRLTVVLAALGLVSLAANGAWGQDASSEGRVFSASKQWEAAREAPMPVTVITEAMIAAIGAQNLKDVLVAYVPGMTFSQDHNEVNIAMRGVYASSQQKILVLIDGHVLNSRSYAASNPDFSITLDNIKRIEVVRGPVSSLYGHGALTAVINIFTKTTGDIDKTLVSAGGGSFGQLKLSAVQGIKTATGTDLVAWGSVYRSNGQVVDIPASEDYSRSPANARAILGGFKEPASHDVGMSLKTKRFTLFAAHRYGKYVEPFTDGAPTGESYNYADYQAGNGVGPGLGIGAFNLDVSHTRSLGKDATLRLQGYVDRREVTVHIVNDPTQKAHSAAVWKEWDAGVVGEASGAYATASGGGQWFAGFQVDLMRVYDSYLSSGTGGGWSATTPSGGLLALGREGVYSGFLQVRHRVSDRWIANAGLRYDQKVRHEGAALDDVSPRVALTYLPNERLDVAFSYSGSLVDAPYFYRYNALPSYRGAKSLEPERLRSFQVTPRLKLSDRLSGTLNLFYNNLENLVWRNKDAGPSDPIYQNAGFLKAWGLESEIRYGMERFNAGGNLTYQRAAGARNYDVTGAEIHNVPAWTANAIFNARPFATAQDLLVNVTARYVGDQASPINITFSNVSYREPGKRVDAAFLLNAGVRASRIGSTGWFLDARVYNLFGTRYYQGGSVSHPYLQPGRSVMLTAGCAF